ncbi:MAG TPA: OstA-like protein [Ignavibacteria bacterium]|nr:OstA-like protein [Ignavibacteria bacterium]
MIKIAINIIVLFLLTLPLYSQEKIELKNADQLTGNVVDGKTVREATGNVIIQQGNITVYCNSATQYIDENYVDLRGNVRIIQDTVTLLTSRGTYYGNDKRATGSGGITLKDPNATLTASSGVYYFNDARAIFNGNVHVVNADYDITSDKLTYLRNTEDSFAEGNVVVTTDSAVITAEKVDFLKRQGKSLAYNNARLVSDSTIVTSDTLINFSFEKRSVASGRVKIESQNNNTIVYGDHLENFEVRNYTKVTGNARLIQIDEPDTLFIYSRIMEAYRNDPEYYVATDSVETIRGDFLSKSGLSTFYADSETVSLSLNPIVWQEESQMTGDSIYADLPGKKLQTIYIKKLENLPGSKYSFVISQNADQGFYDRYNQVKGTDITMHFLDEQISRVDVTGSSQSIYFTFENLKANGVNRAEGKNMIINFDETEQVSKIMIDSDPVGQYIPEVRLSAENLILPGFLFRDDKPVRR